MAGNWVLGAWYWELAALVGVVTNKHIMPNLVCWWQLALRRQTLYKKIIQAC